MLASPQDRQSIGIKAREYIDSHHSAEVVIKEFEAAAYHAITWKIRRHHRWTMAPDPTIKMPQAVQRTEALVSTAVERQLESDVPLGCLLSGGIDSSLVSVAAQKVLGGGLRTFNVRFSDKKYDETWAAKAVADHIRSDHTILDMDAERGTWSRVTNILLHVLVVI